MADTDEKIDLPVETPVEDDIVVKIDDELVQKPAPKVEEEVDDREKAVAELRQQLDREKQARATEEERRAQLEAYAKEQAYRLREAHVDVRDGQLRTILNALDATEQTAQAAERALADALAAGDYATVAKAHRAISQCETHLNDLNKGKRALQEQLERPTEGAVREPPPPRTPPPPKDPLDEMVARLTPKSAEWLRAHPQAVGQVSKLTAAHSAAVELEGLTAETPEYFAYIEQRLGYTQPEKSVAKPAKPAKASAPSIPVSSSASSGGGSGGSMVLSSQEVEMAMLAEPTLPREKALEVWARNKAALQREGKMK